MRVSSKFEKSGFFWLPGKKDIRVPGTLTISDGGDIELEIVGLLDESAEAVNSRDIIPRVNGEVEKDGYVTLENCFYRTKSIPFGSITKSTLISHKVLSGVGFDEDEEIEINSLSFKIEGVDEWVGISGIKVETNDKMTESIIRYTQPDNIKIDLYNGMLLEICFSYSIPIVADLKESKIKQSVYLKLSSETPYDLQDFTDITYRLANLLCLATEETVSIYDLTAFSENVYYVNENNEKDRLVPIKIYYPSIPFSKNKPKIEWHRMLFRFGHLGDDRNIKINNWLKLYDSISPTLSLFFSAQTGAHKYMEGRFLALAQGLETYHRRTTDIKLMAESEFHDLVSSIVESCPEDKKEWLEGRLMHGNEISFRNRIKDLISPFKENIGSNKKRNQIINKILNTRNYLTHYNETLEDSTAKSNELYSLCCFIEVFLQLHFLSKIGFDEKEIKSIIDNSFSIRQKLAREI